MAGIGPGDVYQAATDYLNLCLVALATTTGGAPARSFVSPGVPAWDCPNQLSVHVGGPAIADTLPLVPVLQPGHRVTTTGEVNLLGLTATILRCAPLPSANGQPPTPAQINAVSQVTTADLWAIWAHIKAGKRAATFFAPKERELFIDPAVSLNQAGGVCGWEITIRVQLDGYTVT